jgi:hypothetical protein
VDLNIENVSLPKVKIVAIAKDEAAYIPEWIHHHLYFGFDAIDIYINRTSDNSVQMLQQISMEYPQIKAFNADWVDMCPQGAQNNLQYIIYAKALEDARSSGDFDYILFLDVDEFWTPKNLLTSVQDCILKNPNADTISFQWINAFGQKDVFTGLQQLINGRINPLVKTLIKLDVEVKKIGFHFPELVHGQSFLVDGAKFIADAKVKEGLHKELQYLRPVMIIHRMFRSPLEYISLLNRGRPSDELQIKLNRGGYNEAAGREVLFELNKKSYIGYQTSFKQFLSKISVQQQLDVARQFIHTRYHNTLTYLPKVPIRYFPDLFRIFKGCTDKEYKILTDAVINSERLKRCKDPDELIELAKSVEKNDLRVAYVIWNRALEIRPKGPLIKARIKKIDEMLTKSGS